MNNVFKMYLSKRREELSQQSHQINRVCESDIAKQVEQSRIAAAYAELHLVEVAMNNNRPKPLKQLQWDALAKAEAHFYRQDVHSGGCHAWTDVMPNEGSELLNEMWEQAQLACEGDDVNAVFREAEVARR
jgi:hypothetical protein